MIPIKIETLEKKWIHPTSDKKPGYWIHYNHLEKPCVYIENLDSIELCDGYELSQLDDVISFLQLARKALSDGIRHG